MNSDLNSNFTLLYLDFALKKAVFTFYAGHSARVWNLLGTNVNTPFFQVPLLEFRHSVSCREQGRDSVLVRTKVAIGSLCAHHFW